MIGVITELVVKGGNIDWRTAAVLAAGFLLGSVFGGQCMRRIPDTPLRWGSSWVLSSSRHDGC